MKRTALAVAALSAVLFSPLHRRRTFRDSQTIERRHSGQERQTLITRLVQFARRRFGTVKINTDAPIPPRQSQLSSRGLALLCRCDHEPVCPSIAGIIALRSAT